MLPGLTSAITGSRPDATVAYVSRNNSSANASTYTFSAQDYSGPGVILVGAVGRRNVAGVGSFSGLTIDGVAMAQQVSLITGDNQAAIYSLRVGAGASADMILDISGADAFARVGVGIWRAVGLDSATASATGSSGADPGSIASINVSAGGIIVGISYAAATHTNTWGGTAALTEDWDAGEVETNGYTGASQAFVGGATGLTITVTRTNNLEDVLVAAAFR